jgi:hypothetical protein
LLLGAPPPLTDILLKDIYKGDIGYVWGGPPLERVPPAGGGAAALIPNIGGFPIEPTQVSEPHSSSARRSAAWVAESSHQAVAGRAGVWLVADLG